MLPKTNNTVAVPYTTDPVAAPANSCNKPEFLRLPKSGTLCPWTGLSRSKMWQVIQSSNGKIKTVCLRRKGAVKGARLIHFDSLMNYLHSIAEGGE